jgi:hypothetical protein
MFKRGKKHFIAWSLIIGTFIAGVAFPADIFAKEIIIGKVSSIDDASSSLMILKDLVEIDASNSKIRKKGVDNATLTDIEEGDIVKIEGNARRSRPFMAKRIKDPVKLKDYDGMITGKTKNVSTSKKTFRIGGQDIDAGSISGITMSSRSIPFDKFRSGVSVDVYVKTGKSGLTAQKIVIRQESCTYCHGK